MKGSLNHLSHKYINPIEVEIRIEAIIMVGLGITMRTGFVPCITRIFRGTVRDSFNYRANYGYNT